MRSDEKYDLFDDDAVPLKRRKKNTGLPEKPAQKRFISAADASYDAQDIPTAIPLKAPSAVKPVSKPASKPASPQTPKPAAAPQSKPAAAKIQSKAPANAQRPAARPAPGAAAQVKRTAVKAQEAPAKKEAAPAGKHIHAVRDNVRSTGAGSTSALFQNNGPAKPAAPKQTGQTKPLSAQTSAQSKPAQKQPIVFKSASLNEPDSMYRSAPQRNAGTQRGRADDAVSIPVRRSGEVRRNKGYVREADNKPKHKFRKFFLIYLGVLLILSVIFLIYVHSLLVNFEGSQVDNVVAEKLEDIKKAASKGKIESEISLDAIKENYSPTDEEIKDYERAFAIGDLTYKKTRNGLSSDTESYAIYLNGFNVGKMELKTLKEEMVLAIFPVTEWSIESCSAETFSFDFPDSVTITSGGKTIDGKPSETEGLYSYTASSLFSPDTVITDSAGNTASFNGKDPVTFTNCTVKVLSTYKVYSGDKLIDPSKAAIETIEKFKYVKEYCPEVPDLAVYRLCLIDDGSKITVKDASGNEVACKQPKDSVYEAYDFAMSDTMPQDLAGTPNPLEAAEKLSLFTSDDLGGGYPHGFYTLADYLIKDSYLYEKNWEFATSVDITFTSDHSLDNPPFNSEKVSEFVRFSDKCFSCKIEFNKPMYMTNGVNKIDSVNGTFYFVYYDDSDDGVDNPHWGLVDRQDDAKKIN